MQIIGWEKMKWREVIRTYMRGRRKGKRGEESEGKGTNEVLWGYEGTYTRGKRKDRERGRGKE